MKLVIRNARLPDRENPCDLVIEQGHIASVGTQLEAPGAAVIEADGGVVFPGLVDAHMHLDKSYLTEIRPYQDGTPPQKVEWTRQLKKQFTAGDVRARSLKVINQAIAAGTTAIRTNVDIDPRVGLTALEPLLQLREELKDHITLQVTAFAQEGVLQEAGTFGLLEEALKLGADAVGGHTSIEPDGEKHIDTILDLAGRYKVPVDFHTDETGRPEHFLLPYLAERVVQLGLQERVLALHCCSLSSVEPDKAQQAIEAAAEAKINIAICPSAVATRALAPIKKLWDAGINVALGSDNIRDTFGPLGNGDLLQIAFVLLYVSRIFTEEEQEKLVQTITYGGAKALGLPQYGLNLGSKADLVIFRAAGAAEALTALSPRVIVLKKGKVVFRSSCLPAPKVI